jgi:membrane protease YdiL (CAAX protease family)
MRSRPLASFFVAVFAITWSIAAAAIFASAWFTRTFGQLDARNPVFFLGVYAPSIVAMLLTARLEGRAGLGRLFARLDPRRCHPLWYLVVIGGFLVLTGAAAAAGRWLGGAAPVTHFGGGLGILAAGIFLDPGPLGEELGWRGFALPRMLARWHPLVATLGLGMIWGAWHLPAFYVSTLSQSQLSLPIFLLGAVSLSVVVGWLFLRTNGSVLITILAHAMANHAGDVTGASFNQLAAGLTVVAIGLIAGGGLAARPAPIAPAAA